jgi:hypothetical protein
VMMLRRAILWVTMEILESWMKRRAIQCGRQLS